MKYILIFLLSSASIHAQNDTLQFLEEVKLHGNFSSKLNTGYHIQILSDSLLNNTSQSLGDLLEHQANLYFKQNGLGMVSSISLRGSGASHTGIYWNGIGINSTLNGQTDFNTLSANGFNQIEIRKGSGSTLFGSGAIGGAINLKDIISFSPIFQNNWLINLSTASYNTQSIFAQGILSGSKTFAKISIEGYRSDNDYPYIGTDIINENGISKNHHIKSAFGYKINTDNQLKFFTSYSSNYRELSRTLTAPSKNLLKNTDNRLLLNWLNTGYHYNSNLNIAFLNEYYAFYLNKDNDTFSYGKTDNGILKYDFKYLLQKGVHLSTGLETKFSKSNGSNILTEERLVLEYYALFHHELTKFSYNTSIRKGHTDLYKIPLIYALDTRFNITPQYNIRANYSTNYRIPTFNDLYWEYSGNKDLISETSKAIEFGHYYSNNNLNISALSYYIKSKDLIQWRPETATFWRPINVQSVSSKGFEFTFDYSKQFNTHRITLNAQYSYTKSTDHSLDKELMYVPNNKVTTQFNYAYNGWSFNYNFHYTDKAYTTTSNTLFVDEYRLHNIELHKEIKPSKINIGLYINNLWNENYQVVSYRPMPNRNFKLNINIKL